MNNVYEIINVFLFFLCGCVINLKFIVWCLNDVFMFFLYVSFYVKYFLIILYIVKKIIIFIMIYRRNKK